LSPQHEQQQQHHPLATPQQEAKRSSTNNVRRVARRRESVVCSRNHDVTKVKEMSAAERPTDGAPSAAARIGAPTPTLKTAHHEALALTKNSSGAERKTVPREPVLLQSHQLQEELARVAERALHFICAL